MSEQIKVEFRQLNCSRKTHLFEEFFLRLPKEVWGNLFELAGLEALSERVFYQVYVYLTVREKLRSNSFGLWGPAEIR